MWLHYGLVHLDLVPHHRIYFSLLGLQERSKKVSALKVPEFTFSVCVCVNACALECEGALALVWLCM